MFFESWYALFRIVVVGVMAYAALVVLLRITGKRTLTKLNAFDLVVTVALGSTLATILLSKQVPLVDGVVALALLVVLQFAVTWMSVHNRTIRSLVRSEPRLLYHRGELLREAMRDERINEEEILQAMRSGGFADFEQAQAVVLETDGSMSVIPRGEAGRGTLANVSGGDPA